MSGVVHPTIDPATLTFGVGVDLGSGVHLHLDERWASFRPLSRSLRVPLCGALVPDDLESIVIRAGLPDGVVEQELTPVPHLVWDHLWSGLDQAAQPIAGSVVVPMRVGWKRRARRGIPRRTQWWDQVKVIGTWDGRELGLGGLVPAGYHHLEADAAVMWSGNGQRNTEVEIVLGEMRGARNLHRVPAADDDQLVVTRRGIHVFDAKGRHRYTVDHAHHRERFSTRYDEHGRLAGWVVDGWSQYQVEHHHGEAHITAPGGHRSVIRLRDDLRITSAVLLTGGEVTFAVDSFGVVESITDPVGLRVDVGHDPDGRATSLQWSSGARFDTVMVPLVDGQGSRTLTAGGREFSETRLRLPDGAHQIRRRCCGSEAETVSTTRGEETLTIRPDGTQIQRLSHAARSATAETTTDRVLLRTPQGRAHEITRTRISSVDGTVEERLQKGTRVWHRRIDALTGSLTETSPSGLVTRFVAEGDDLQRWSRPDAGTIEYHRVDGLPVRIVRGDQVSDVTYDDHGRVAAISEGGRVLEFRHDAASQLVAEELAAGWLLYERDPAGRIVATTVPSGHTTRYERAVDGLVTAVVRPTDDGEVTERLTYDDDRQLIARHVEGASPVAYQLDPAGRVTSTRAGDTRVDSEWDAASGRPIRMVTEAADAVVYHRDGYLLLAEEAQGRVPGVVAYEYDSDHLVSAVTISGTRLNVERDADGEVVVYGPVRAVRSPERGLVGQILVGGLATSYEYDATGAMISHATYLGETLVFAETITRGTRGEITTVVEHRGGDAVPTTYSYDETGRLARVERDGQRLLGLTYDHGDNVVNYERGGSTDVAEVGAGDRLRSYAGAPTPHSPAGNILELAGREFRYDGMGQVAEVVVEGGPTVGYRRDAKRRPIEVTVDETTLWQLLWADDRVAAITCPDGRTLRCASATGRVAPDAIFDDNRTFRLITDHRGSVRLVVDATSGELMQDLRYDPLGHVIEDSNPGFQPFGYAGALHDTTTGLVHLGARELDVRTSRFLQPDPIGFAGGQPNLYLYAAGDPVNRHDPGGLQSSGTGTVEVCKVEVGTSAPSTPTSQDHGFLKFGDRRRGMGGSAGNTRWVDEHEGRAPSEACHEVENVDAECLETYTTPGTPLGRYHPYNICWDSVWDALDACSVPGKRWKWGDRRPGDPAMPLAKGHQVGRPARRGAQKAVGAVVDAAGAVADAPANIAKGARKMANEFGKFINDVYGY